MLDDLLQGELVRLAADNPERVSEADSRWSRNSEYLRLLEREPVQMWSVKKIKQWIERDLEKDHTRDFAFSLHTLHDGKLIGYVGLFSVQWTHGNAWMSIGIGDREYWDRGFGADAMRLILRYAFTELNLHRVTLGVFAYNPRAIRSYEKVGFIVEGREREALYRDGERADSIIMGMLRQEWLARYVYREENRD